VIRVWMIFRGRWCSLESRRADLNRFCMSLRTAANRARFLADERSYVDEWPMTDVQKRAVLERDWNSALAEGANIYFLAKVLATDGTSFPEAASAMTGVSVAEYVAMMAGGGRSPDGQRSIRQRCSTQGRQSIEGGR
jgi:protocatechuate 4,5-dioxygenase, alpha chain